MHFVHLSHLSEETIAAIATPPGEGGIAIIRISGKEAISVADRIFSGPVPSYTSHTAHFGHIHDLSGDRVDDVLLLVMRAPRSYTGEDTVEIHCHGGSLVTRRVLETVLSAGARAAQPGEFTFRAFRNGKIDLAQAEAVQTLIGARSEEALSAAEQQLQGALSEKVQAVQEKLTRIAAIFEAWVDFPEEGLAFASMEEVISDLKAQQKKIRQWIDTFHQGKILHEGLTLCLVGAPNVGKSSLMNALLEKERAIVSPTPGTTRDIVEDQMRLNGLHFRLIDTAGIRETAETVEQEGIRRTKRAMEEADLIVFVLDGSRPITGEEEEMLSQIPKNKSVVVWNKMDLPRSHSCSLALPQVVALSATEKRGLEDLHKAIDAVIWHEGPPSKEEVVITHIRHKEALERAAQALEVVLSGLQEGVSPELLTMDLRKCLEQLGQIVGTHITEKILSSIFSQFCIGK